jgi:hypothetical protein
MSLRDVIPPSVCGTCQERPRPKIVQHHHAAWWDLLLGCYAKCPDCGNVFEPSTWSPDDGDDQYIHTDHSEVGAHYGESIISKAYVQIENLGTSRTTESSELNR